MLKFAAISIAALAASSAYAAPSNTAADATAPSAAAGGPVRSSSDATAPTGTTDPAATAGAVAAQQPSSGTTAQAQPAQPANANTQVVAVIEAGFPKYDANADGKLSDVEFKQWISDLKTSELTAAGKPADTATVTQYSSAALTSADTDKDKSVTKAELTTFLGG